MAFTTMVPIVKTFLIDAIGKLTFGNTGEMMLEDFDSTINYFSAISTGAGLSSPIELMYMTAL